VSQGAQPRQVQTTPAGVDRPQEFGYNGHKT
jgi:hypothetical protein